MHVSYLGSSESAAFIAANSIRIPFYSQTADASTPVEDVKNSGVDLNTMFTNNPAATFFVRAKGDFVRAKSDVMEKGDIFLGDVLIVDRSLTARHGDTVIAREQGKMSVVTLQLNPDVLLRPKNKAYSASSAPVVTREASGLEVFGVVTSVVRQIDRG